MNHVRGGYDDLLKRAYWAGDDRDIRELKIFLRVGECVQTQAQDAELPDF